MENTTNEIWQQGTHPSTVISNKKVKNTNFPVPPNKEESSDEDLNHYGGYLVCESIGNIGHTKIIAMAPQMIAFVKEANEFLNFLSSQKINLFSDKMQKLYSLQAESSQIINSTK